MERTKSSWIQLSVVAAEWPARRFKPGAKLQTRFFSSKKVFFLNQVKKVGDGLDEKKCCGTFFRFLCVVQRQHLIALWRLMSPTFVIYYLLNLFCSADYFLYIIFDVVSNKLMLLEYIFSKDTSCKDFNGEFGYSRFHIENAK